METQLRQPEAEQVAPGRGAGVVSRRVVTLNLVRWTPACEGETRSTVAEEFTALGVLPGDSHCRQTEKSLVRAVVNSRV
jgi:hypothetical protein